MSVRAGMPAARNAAAIADPTNPLAPVTRTRPVGCDAAGMGICNFVNLDCREILAAIVSAQSFGSFVKIT
jgi:hypothetical protein